MTLQVLLRDFVVADPALTTLIPAERWKAASSVSEENTPERMFVVMRWGAISVGVGKVRRHLCTFWIHDNPGSYTDLNKVLSALDGRLDGAVSLRAEGNEAEIQAIHWSGTSGDLQDPGFKTITRNIAFEVIGKEA